MKYIWFPLCLIFALFSHNREFCGGTILNQMWFMWIIMSLMHIDVYVELVRKKLNAN